MKNKEMKPATTLFEITLIILMVITIMLIIYCYATEYGDEEKAIQINFKLCIEQVAENYCQSISKNYKSVLYRGGSRFTNKDYQEKYHYVNKPIQIICKDKRECCDVERYYFLDKEIYNCLDNASEISREEEVEK